MSVGSNDDMLLGTGTDGIDIGPIQSPLALLPPPIDVRPR
jgi:hypothetical protein